MPEERFQLNSASLLHPWADAAPGFAEIFSHFRENAYPDAEIIWKTRHKYVKKIRLAPGQGAGTVIFKKYREQRFWRYLLRPSLARREAEGYCVAQSFGIPTAEILACGEERSLLKLSSSFIMTRFIEHTFDGGVFMAESPLMERENSCKLSFCRQNLDYLARLHKAGFVHGGSHPRNFLWMDLPDGPKVIWIDLATIRKNRSLRAYRHYHDDIRHLLAPLKLSSGEKEELTAYYTSLNPAVKINPATLHIKLG